MSAWNDMIGGAYYDSNDENLMDLWYKAKELITQYNQISCYDIKARDDILKKLLGKKGENIWIVSPFYVDFGINIFFGNNCEVNMNCIFLDDNKITIGNNTLIAPNVQIYTAYHPMSGRERVCPDGTHKVCSAPVTIGNDCWIGGGTIVLPGVTIGNNVVIGAGSVVTKSIPDNVIAYGNPCRIVKSNL